MDFHISVLGHTLDFFPDNERRDTQSDNTPLLAALAAALIPALLRPGKEPAPSTPRENDALQSWGFWLKKLGETPDPADFPQPPPIQGLPQRVQPFAAAIHLLWGELGPPAEIKAASYVNLIVNGVSHPWVGKSAGYMDILMLSGIGAGGASEPTARITYSESPHLAAVATLAIGERVEVADGMIFTVVR